MKEKVTLGSIRRAAAKVAKAYDELKKSEAWVMYDGAGRFFHVCDTREEARFFKLHHPKCSIYRCTVIRGEKVR